MGIESSDGHSNEESMVVDPLTEAAVLEEGGIESLLEKHHYLCFFNGYASGIGDCTFMHLSPAPVIPGSRIIEDMGGVVIDPVRPGYPEQACITLMFSMEDGNQLRERVREFLKDKLPPPPPPQNLFLSTILRHASSLKGLLQGKEQ